MFVDKTYERLLADVLARAPAGIDTRPGSIFYDAVASILLEIAKLYTDIDLIAEMTSVATAVDEALTVRAAEYGVWRLAPTKAKYYVSFEGVAPPLGERFYTDGQYFSLQQDMTGVYYLAAEPAGSAGNKIYSGTPAVPVNTIEGLTAATFGALYESGTDAESDESLRLRVQEKIAGPAENGNKQHYKTWCESIDGVGRAQIYPLWNGPNTVKAVLIDSAGLPCSPANVAEVQNYIDPATRSYTTTVNGLVYTVGDGLGEGVANLGSHFTAAAANALAVSVSFTAEWAGSVDKENMKQQVQQGLADYFRRLVLDSAEGTVPIIRLSAVGAILSALPGLLDYHELRLNGESCNITPGEDDVPVLTEVQIA